MADQETPDPAQAFARLMSGSAAAAAPQADPEAPYGWTVDKDGNRRPKKTRGRPRKSDADTPADGPAPAAAAAQPAAAAAEGQDPDPAWVQDPQDGKPAKRKRKQTIEDVPKETVNDMAGFAGLIGAPLLAVLQQSDPYCGSVLAQNYEPIVDAVLPLLCRSKKITDYFAGDQSDWLLWGKLAMALAPVGRAIIEHHVFRSVEVVRDPVTGAVQVVRRQASPDHGDHLVPPGPAFEYAA